MIYSMNWKTPGKSEIRDSKFEKKRAKKLAEIIKRYCSLNSAIILDVGGGEGTVTQMIMANLNLKSHIINLDISLTALERSKKLNIYDSVIRADCTRLPFKDEIFDMVFVLEVLYYLDDYSDCLSEIYRVLKPGGYLVGSVALGKDYLNWRKFIRDCENYFEVIKSEVLRYPFWFLKRRHYGKGILVRKKRGKLYNFRGGEYEQKKSSNS